MSTSQDQYINSLKKIKKVEEDAQKEIDSYKSKIEDQIIQLDSELEQAMATAKSEGEKLVDSSVEEATKKAGGSLHNLLSYGSNQSEAEVKRIGSANMASHAAEEVKVVMFETEYKERELARLAAIIRSAQLKSKNISSLTYATI